MLATSGAVMGMSVVGLAILGLSLLYVAFSAILATSGLKVILATLTGFSMGASSIAPSGSTSREQIQDRVNV